jgi:hypothetical protein
MALIKPKQRDAGLRGGSAGGFSRGSPAPFVHATDDSTAIEFRVRYRAFVDAFRCGAQCLRDRARELADMFPLWSFPPALPFNAPA